MQRILARDVTRFLLPLLALLALVAWSASEVVNRQARVWAERDLAARAQLAASGARESLVARIGASDRAGTLALLNELVRDERLLAAAVCGGGGRTLAATAALPAEFRCGHPAGPIAGAEWEASRQLAGGTVHVSVIPIEDQGVTRGELVLVHDMSYLDRRAAVTRRATFVAFALVGLLAAAATVLVARFSWRSWTAELRRVLALPFQLAATASPHSFQPFLADVRDLVARLAAAEAAASGARWSADRIRTVLERDLRGEGVIVVANREPYVHERTPEGGIQVEVPASGLVTALEPIMRACSGTWIAHGDGSADRDTVDPHDRVRVPPDEETYTLRRLWLSPEEVQGHYAGFSNEGLWPLCHLAHTRPEFRADDLAQYARVNRRFADAVVEEASSPDPVVLVQDYHFALLPRLLRERLPRATVLTFWHIPWPNAERFAICPWGPRLLEGLLGSSILGFHTQGHCNNFLESVDRFLEARIDRERQAVVAGGHETLVRPYPISVEWPNRWAARTASVPECREEVRRELGLPPDAILGIGVDRLDYTKGIPERLLAVERFLLRHPGYQGRFWFLQLAAPSRSKIDAYRRVGEEVERIAARINERFGGAYRPIVLHRAHADPPQVFRLYRAADLCYVSSLHDGMNLVAKEFVAARDDLRGVLVLSQFTGAARELTEALIVNPYDLEAASDALAAAVAMAPAEQEDRMRALRAMVAEWNVFRWAGRMLVDATRLRRQDRLASRLVGLAAGPPAT